MAYRSTYSNEFYHHGIKGQKWGERNGPPYPLGAERRSASERKNSLDKGGNKGYNKNGGTHGQRLTYEQKKALMIGATAVAGTLAVCGAYKTGLLNADTVARGRNIAGDALKAIGKQPVDGISELPKQGTGLKRLAKPESLAESISIADPYGFKGGAEGRNGCTRASVTGCLRRLGYDVRMKPVGSKDNIFEGGDLGGLVEQCFKDAKVFDGSAVTFGKSRQDASAMLVRRFGDNAEGVCSVKWRRTDEGHAFNWSIKDGKVTFMDFQQRKIGEEIDWYWKNIDTNGPLALARLDNVEPIFEELLKIME